MSGGAKPRERFGELLEKVDGYYSAKVREHGAGHRGVDWNSQESQELRFEQLLKVVEPPSTSFSLNDYGCGYGALRGYLAERGFAGRYRGYDVSAPMLEQARKISGGRIPGNGSVASDVGFVDDPVLLEPAEYTVASGIFNVRLDTPDDVWLQYVLDTIDELAAKSTKGFAFNMLTSFSDPERMRPDLYYGDPHFFFEHCRKRFSRRIALLHDYPLYEFTIVVRLA